MNNPSVCDDEPVNRLGRRSFTVGTEPVGGCGTEPVGGCGTEPVGGCVAGGSDGGLCSGSDGIFETATAATC